jgi:hypothetical protein
MNKCIRVCFRLPNAAKPAWPARAATIFDKSNQIGIISGAAACVVWRRGPHTWTPAGHATLEFRDRSRISGLPAMVQKVHQFARPVP